MGTRKSNYALILHLVFHIVYAACGKRKVEKETGMISPRANWANRVQFDMIESYITHDIHNAFKRRPVKSALVKVAC